VSEPITLAFVDCETTGLRPDHGHGIWELAVIIRRITANHADGADAEWEEEHVWQIRPDLNDADPEALNVNDFVRRFKVPPEVDALWFPEFQREPVPQGIREAVRQIADLLDGAYLVGAVPAFDAMMLAHLLRSHGDEPRWRHRLVCVESLVAGAVGQRVPRGLQQAASAVGVWVDPEARHTAMGDTRVAREVYDAVMDRAVSPVGTAPGGSDVVVSRADLVAYLNRGTGDVAEEVAALNRLLAAAGIED
jgi:DNA polymerase III epsilon subunit-like protein